MHDVLFTPFVTVNVTDDEKVVGVEIDWSDTLKNDYADGVEVWSDGDDIQPPTTTAACSYLDDKATRERVLAAFQPAQPVDDNMTISFVGEAYESFQRAVDSIHGYGVTIVKLDGTEVEAIIVGADYNAEDGATITYIPVDEREYELRAYDDEEDAVSEIVRRIIVS